MHRSRHLYQEVQLPTKRVLIKCVDLYIHKLVLREPKLDVLYVINNIILLFRMMYCIVFGFVINEPGVEPMPAVNALPPLATSYIPLLYLIIKVSNTNMKIIINIPSSITSNKIVNPKL
jgi:hypothetical protein